MCKLKSAIILKDRVFIPDYDSHADMLKELGIEDSRKNAETLFVRAELSPKNDDVFSNVDTWEFNVDQDIRPEWFVEPYEKKRMVKAVKEWTDNHILIGRKSEEISDGTYYLKDCIDIKFCDNSTVEACGNSTVRACGNSTVEACDNSTVEAYDNSTVEACGNSTVEACGNSTVRACGNSTVRACGNSTVRACGNSTVRAYDNSTVKAYGNSTVRAYDNSTVEACDNSTVEACGNSTVRACGNSTVEACDNSTVRAYGNSTVRAYDNSTAIIPDWSSNKRDNIVLMQNSTLKDCKTKTIYQSGDWQFVKVEGIKA